MHYTFLRLISKVGHDLAGFAFELEKARARPYKFRNRLEKSSYFREKKIIELRQVAKIWRLIMSYHHDFVHSLVETTQRLN